jgi:tetratricopeptide (TPR) repeat protein
VGALVPPLLLLGAAELGLRLAGYGYPTGFFQKAVIGGRECLVENARFGWRFFPPGLARIPSPIVMEAEKPADTIRIFVLGESAAMGDPWPHFGASRYLEVLLAERYPGRKFEVVNTAMTAINSHTILPIARECARRDGDLWIIYMGNNEMVGPYGAATVFGRQAPSLAFVRFNLALRKLRLGQLLADWSRKFEAGKDGAPPWGGMEMFLQNKVPPEDPRRAVVHRNFRRNLEDILEAGLGSGAKVVLSTMAVNLKDCPPFGSLAGAAAPAADQDQQPAYDPLRAEAAAAAKAGDFPAARTKYERLVKLAPRSAEAHYGLAQCLLRLGDAAAREHFQMALDYDTLPFRTDSLQNRDIIEAAKRRGADPRLALCDAAAALATNSPAGICGEESFYEHVHFNFNGNYLLARAWAEALQKLLPPNPGNRLAAAWATREQCERLLGLTDWNRVSVLEEVISRLNQPPLDSQPNNPARLEALRKLRDEARRRMGENAAESARAVYREALQRAPNDHYVRENYAEFLEATGDTQQAVAEWKRVCEQIPHYYFPHYFLGRLLKERREFAEARGSLLRAAALNPRQADVRLQLGSVYALEKKWDLALREFELGRQLSPADPRPPQFAADALWKLNRRTEAIESLRTALQLKPDFVDARYRLAELLATMDRVPEAAREFEEVVRSRPDHLRARLNLAVALARLGRADQALRQLDEVLRLDPQNPQANEMKRGLAGARGSSPPR